MITISSSTQAQRSGLEWCEGCSPIVLFHPITTLHPKMSWKQAEVETWRTGWTEGRLCIGSSREAPGCARDYVMTQSLRVLPQLALEGKDRGVSPHITIRSGGALLSQLNGGHSSRLRLCVREKTRPRDKTQEWGRPYMNKVSSLVPFLTYSWETNKSLAFL